MSESQLRDRVHEVLSEADASSGAIVSGDDSNDGDESDLLETAAEARDVLESADPDELLAAVGLDALEDGSEPDSIPEAIARGDQENVESLRRLLRLSKLADRADDGRLEGAVDDLRETIGERAEGADGESAAARDDGDEASTGDESDAAESTAESDGDESDATEDIGDRLRSAMSDSFADFGDEVSRLKERLEERSAGAAGSDSEDGTDADETAADAEDGATDGEGDDAEDDEGLLGSGLGDEERGTTSGGPSRHSTMAPSPSQRADMRKTTRHSTMPDKHG